MQASLNRAFRLSAPQRIDPRAASLYPPSAASLPHSLPAPGHSQSSAVGHTLTHALRIRALSIELPSIALHRGSQTAPKASASRADTNTLCGRALSPAATSSFASGAARSMRSTDQARDWAGCSHMAAAEGSVSTAAPEATGASPGASILSDTPVAGVPAVEGPTGSASTPPGGGDSPALGENGLPFSHSPALKFEVHLLRFSPRQDRFKAQAVIWSKVFFSGIL